jgi:ribose transport system substrate-binding protein
MRRRTTLGLMMVALLSATTWATAVAQDDGPTEIYVLQPAPSDPYPREDEGIMAEAAKYDDVNVTIDHGTAQTDATTMITKINDAVTRGVDVIMVNSGAVGEQLVLPLEEAIAKGVQVVTFDQDVPVEGRKSYIVWDASDAGTIAGQHFREQVLAEHPDGGPIGMIIAFKGNPLLGAIDDGFRAAIEGSGLEVVSEIDTEGDANRSRTATEDILLANPDLVGLFVDNDLATIGVRAALEARGDKPFMMGVFGTPEAFDEIAKGESGWQDATVASPFQAIGAVALRTAVAVANGEEVPELQELPSLLITPDNAAQAVDQILALAEE